MPKLDESEDLRRVHVMMYQSDYDWYMAYFGNEEAGGFSKAIRKVLRAFRKQIEEKQQTKRQSHDARADQSQSAKRSED